MITIVAKCQIKAGEKANYISTARELIELSNKEAGCLSYDLYEDIHNENILTFIENWQDQKSIDVHNNSEHFRRIVPMLGKLQERPTELSLYTKI